ncbi:RNA ligase [Heyndrickxia camelliae]|uniref:Phosphatase n=1 Tax=Heyndrickxia camelliae TaxID=1707093 RepID=A0A2N3LCN6_9BACI|nr:RNA ligase [Heyndrickxia camelliae]PKR82422.1 phosphatase [Heyndrickxia camelliae]
MRHLVLLRGAMGSGKSTFIKENKLEQFTLSADDIRLLFQTPVMTENGTYTINAKNDNKVWKFLFELLEERMKRGEFTVIDATHAKTEAISRYKQLAQSYRYRVSVVDFSNVSLEKLLEQNKLRPEYKHVPDHAIMNSYERMQTENVPKWVNVIKPHEFQEVMQFKPIDLSEWKRIHHIGDIHGCYTALMEYLNGGLKEDELYIFVGDLLDRGLENDKVLQFFIDIKDNQNVIILEGNHEHHIKTWSHDEECVSRVFENSTQPQLEQAGIDKKDVRQLYRRLRQLVYYTYGDKTVVVTHGGISKIPDNFMFLSTEQLIKGVGDYELDIDYAFENNEYSSKQVRGGIGNKLMLEWFSTVYQIHGHRNIFRLPVQAAKNSFNLEGQVEKGGHLRVVTLSKDGFDTHEIKNKVFKLNKGDIPAINEDELTIDNFLEYLQNHKYISEKQLGGNISSFNFTRKAFNDKVWDDINVKARGLFINTNTKEIVSRSYNKFFNVNERSFTKISALADNMKFPVTIYDKPNGYLGTVGYDSETDELVFTSKSELRGEHAEWVKEMFYKTFKLDTIQFIKDTLKNMNLALVFEVILVEKDPHIIEYNEDKLILLDMVKRDVHYGKVDYENLQLFGRQIGIEVKEKVSVIDNWTDFYKWYREITNDWSIEKEGFVIEDSSGFMTKIKLPYYNFWKQMRGIKDKIGRKHDHMIKGSSLYTPLHNKFFSWAKTKDKEYLKKSNIIQLRNDFLSEIN